MKKEAINIRVDEELKKKLQAQADKEKRPLANLVILILSQWLERKK